jgi:hypothetical protein
MTSSGHCEIGCLLHLLQILSSTSESVTAKLAHGHVLVPGTSKTCTWYSNSG